MTLQMTSDRDPRDGEAVPVHDARDLTDGGDLAHIRLDEHLYTLRVTRAGKLILTK